MKRWRGKTPFGRLTSELWTLATCLSSGVTVTWLSSKIPLWLNTFKITELSTKRTKKYFWKCLEETRSTKLSTLASMTPLKRKKLMSSTVGLLFQLLLGSTKKNSKWRWALWSPCLTQSTTTNTTTRSIRQWWMVKLSNNLQRNTLLNPGAAQILNIVTQDHWLL